MPPFQISLRVRGDDVDRHGCVSPARLLAYLEHARWESLSDPAMEMGALMRDGHKLVLRAQRASFDHPARYGDELTITVWYRGVGKTSVEIGHSVTAAGGELVAAAIVTAVHLDLQGRPTPVPAVLHSHVVELPLPQRLITAALPETEVPLTAFAFHHTIRPCEIDLFDHVNHARYVDMLDDARWYGEGAQAFGEDWPAGQPLARIALDYRSETRLGQTVAVHLWPLPEDTESPDERGLGCEMRDVRADQPRCRAALWVRRPAPTGF